MFGQIIKPMGIQLRREMQFHLIRRAEMQAGMSPFISALIRYDDASVGTYLVDDFLLITLNTRLILGCSREL